MGVMLSAAASVMIPDTEGFGKKKTWQSNVLFF
jgi:hypothetical protein